MCDEFVNGDGGSVPSLFLFLVKPEGFEPSNIAISPVGENLIKAIIHDV